MKKVREIKIGILLAVVIIVLFWGINFLKGKKIFSGNVTFFIVLDETKGLATSNPVTINGIKVGQVNSIYFHPDASGRVVVKAFIEKRTITIPSNSNVVIRKPSLVGEMEIAIHLGDSPVPIQNKDTLSSTYSPSLTDDLSEQLFPLKEKIESLVVQVDSAFSGVNKLLDKKNIESMAMSFENLSIITRTLASQASKFDRIMSSSEKIIDEFQKSSQDVTVALSNFANLSNQLAEANLGKTLENASKSVESFNSLLHKIQSNEGSLNLLLEDKELYKELKESAHLLGLLLEDIRKNPKKYINFSIF